MVVAIFGGTFNPIHWGHLLVAEHIRQSFALKQVIFIPCALPPHKQKENVISAEHRLAMLTLATAENPCFTTSDIEIVRGGSSYSLDTVTSLLGLYGPEATIYFIVGADAFLDLHTWKKGNKLLELCRFVIIARPGASAGQVINYLHTPFFASFPGLKYQTISDTGPQVIDANSQLYLVETVNLNVSSSDIRQMIRTGKSIKYLVPDVVATYIQKNHLYHPTCS